MLPIYLTSKKCVFPCVAILLLFFGNPLVAADDRPNATAVALTWTGTTSTDWNDPTNWSPNAIPAAVDELTIPNVTNDPVIGNGTSALAGLVTVEPDAQLTIESGGSLTIDDPGFYGIDNSGTINNAGTIQISGGDNVAFNNTGTFINAGGQLNLLGFSSKPLVNNGAITNQSGSSIYVYGTEIGETGIYLESGSFNNSGTVEVTESGYGIILGPNGPSLTNSGGTITIHLVEFGGMRLLAGSFDNISGGVLNIQSITAQHGLNISGGTVNNRSGGEMNIDYIGSNGLQISGGTLDNESVINIGQTGSVGENGLYATVSFSNDSGATINIDNTGARGFYLQNTFFTFNEGTINIGQNGGAATITTTGLETTQSGNYINFGQIHIDNTGEHGLIVNNQFSNSGLLTIGTNGPIGLDGIRHIGSDLNNDACATIELNDNLFNSGTITNTGWMLVNTPDAHTNSATFTNTGGLFIAQPSTIPGVTNEEIFIQPTVSFECVAISPAFELGVTVDYDILGVFFDAAATVSAGTYDVNTNTFTPDTELEIGNHIFYVAIRNPGGNCSQTATWQIFVESCAGLCAIAGTRTWTGAISTAWEEPGNWSPNCVPTANDDVIIPDTDNDPIIGNGVAALAKSGSASGGALLNITSGGSLTIADADSDGLSLNGATLNNSGVLTINGTGRHGIQLNGTFNNLSGGVVNIDGTASNGINPGGQFQNQGIVNIGQQASIGSIGWYLEAGTFTNSAGAEVHIDNTGSDGFNNIFGSVSNEGTINIGQNGGMNNIGGIGLLSVDQFHNLAGVINIDNTVEQGIYADGTTILNYAAINIGQHGGSGNISSHGIQANFGGIYNEGDIRIDYTGKHGIFIEASGSITNSGTMIIGENGAIGLDGIHAEDDFLNEPCGRVELFGNIYSTENFVNDGFLAIHTDQTHTNTGSFTNSGVIAYSQLPLVPNVTNNEIILAPTNSTDCISISPAFSLGATVDFNVLGIFSDANGITAAGSYTAGTNTFTPDPGLMDGTYQLYVLIEDPVGNCTELLPWSLSVSNCPFDPCAEAGTRTWTGALSTAWEDAGNWSPNCVPTSDDEVIIPDTDNDPVIGDGIGALARSVFCSNGAVLSVLSGGTLDITNAANGGLSLDGSTVNNSGTINISQTGAYGISVIGTFNNLDGGRVSMNVLSSDGLQLGDGSNPGNFNNSGDLEIGQNASVTGNGILISAGIFNNNTNGEVLIDNIGADGIRNTAGTLNNYAVILIGLVGVENSIIGAGINNAATLNHYGGTIAIFNTVSTGFAQTGGTVQSESGIYIGPNGPSGNIQGSGLEIEQGVFRSEGVLEIGNAQVHGIAVTGNGVFENTNRIIIAEAGLIGMNGIYNQGSFSNLACGSILLLENVANTATFENAGWLEIDSDQNHSNSGSLINHGIISYRKLPLIPNVTNNEIIIAPTTSTNCTAISPAFELSLPLDLSITGVFVDRNVMVPAGSFSENTNEFIPDEALAEGDYIFYVQIEDTDDNCTRVVPWSVSLSDCITDELCTDNDEVIVDYPISDMQTLRSGDQLKASSTIEATADVTLTAANIITFEPGFIVENGATLHAFIATCTFNDNLQAAIDATTLKTEPLQPAPEVLQVEVFPNPLQIQATVKFYLPVTGDLELTIRDLHGRVMHHQQYPGADAGWQQTEFYAGNLPAGMYLLYMRTEEEQIVKQLVVQQ